MLYLPITQDWLVSRMAQRVYLVCALLSFALFGTRIAVKMVVSIASLGALPPHSAAIVRILFWPEVMGAALLWVAMWYFWFEFDRSQFLKRAAWFVAFLFFAPVGPALYYFLACRRYAIQQQRALQV